MDVLELADGEAVEVSPDSSNNVGCTLDLDVGMVSNPVQDTRQENKAHPKDPVSMTQTRTDEVRTPTTTKSTGLVFKVKSTILGQSNPWSNSQVLILHSLKYHSFLVTAMLPRCGGKHHLDELVVVSVVPRNGPDWQQDEDVMCRPSCSTDFSHFTRRHHCSLSHLQLQVINFPASHTNPLGVQSLRRCVLW